MWLSNHKVRYSVTKRVNIMDSPTHTTAPKFRADEILAGLPYEERRERSRELKQDVNMRSILAKMRKAVWGDNYSPPGDKLLTIATILGVTVNDLYTVNPEPDMHLPH